jgi:hypothetical protein
MSEHQSAENVDLMVALWSIDETLNKMGETIERINQQLNGGLVGYSMNLTPFCLNCVERFDLTNPDERFEEDEFEPIYGRHLKSQTLYCGVPTCQALLNADDKTQKAGLGAGDEAL